MVARCPIFPAELFALIIEKASERTDDHKPLSKEQNITLSACASTCRLFLNLSRRHLFRRIDIGFNEINGERLLRLLGIIQAEPLIKFHIVEVYVHLRPATRRECEPFTLLQACAQHPAQFPVVKTLTLIDTYCYIPRSRPLPRRPLPSWTREFLQLLVQSYVALPTLQSLTFMDTSRIPTLPYTALLRCASTLAELRLIDVDGAARHDSFDIPLNQLRKLTIGDCSDECLSLLPRLHSLSDLTLYGDFDDIETLPASLDFKLTRLEIESRKNGGLSNIFDMLWRPNHLGFKPVSWLKYLSISVVVPQEVPIIKRMLTDLADLHSLTINDNTLSPTTLNLDLSNCSSSFSSLTSVSFWFWHHSTTSPVMSNFVTILPLLASAHQLKGIKLTITALIAEERSPEDDILFHSLSSIIGRLIEFESLDEVETVLEFGLRLDPDASGDEMVLNDDAFMQWLKLRVKEVERSSRVLLYPRFSSTVTPPRPRHYYRRHDGSRSVFMVVYPKTHKDTRRPIELAQM